jgi:CheY-like chemotaxis protein
MDPYRRRLEPFRRILRTLLEQRTDVLIVGEAADGLDAIHQAQALQPDVVMLDVGLPTLNGIEVAGGIRLVAPDARLVLVTNEKSPDLVDEAFRRGTHGYVYKPRITKDLAPVFDAVLGGGRFVSRNLERNAGGGGLASHRHDLLFSSSDRVLVSNFSRFIQSQLLLGAAVIVLVNDSHGESLHLSLRDSNVDFALAIKEERYIPLNITDALSSVMVDGWPDPVQFASVAGELVEREARRATGRHPRVAACGECAPTLWAQGQVEAAIQLEHLWDGVSNRQQVDILCVYPTAVMIRTLARSEACAEHTAVELR